MKNSQLKEVYEDFAVRELKKQVGEILSAMKFTGPEHKERVRARVHVHLELSMRNRGNGPADKPTIPPYILSLKPIYRIARLINESRDYDHFKNNLDNASPPISRLAVHGLLTAFPWRVKPEFRQEPDRPTRTPDSPVLTEIEAALLRALPVEVVMKIVGGSSLDYDPVKKTFTVFPSRENYEEVLDRRDDMHRILRKALGEDLTVEILPLDGSRPAPAVNNAGEMEKNGKAFFRSAQDLADIECMLDDMIFTSADQRDKKRKDLLRFTTQSGEAQNKHRQSRGRAPFTHVKELPIFILSRLISESSSVKELIKKVKNVFPDKPHYYHESVIKRAVKNGSFPWKWKLNLNKNTEAEKTAGSLGQRADQTAAAPLDATLKAKPVELLPKGTANQASGQVVAPEKTIVSSEMAKEIIRRRGGGETYREIASCLNIGMYDIASVIKYYLLWTRTIEAERDVLRDENQALKEKLAAYELKIRFCESGERQKGIKWMDRAVAANEKAMHMSALDENRPSPALNEELIEDVLECLDRGEPHRTIERILGVSRADIAAIAKFYRAWSGIGSMQPLERVRELNAQMDLLEARFGRHIHGKQDGSVYIPITTKGGASC